MAKVSLPSPHGLMKEVRGLIDLDLNKGRSRIKEEFVNKAVMAVEGKRTSVELQFNRNNDSDVILLSEFKQELESKGYVFVVNVEGPYHNVVVSLKYDDKGE